MESQPQPGESRIETFLLDSASRPYRTRRWFPRLLLVSSLLIVLFGAYWSRLPPPVDVKQLARSLGADAAVPGVVSAATLSATLRTLLDKPGGFIANDVLPPGVLLDDMPSFENGALAAARTFLHALRRDFSRPDTGSAEDPDLLRAEPRLLFDSSSWLLPTAESEYEDGLAALDSYRQRLLLPDSARFHPRADGLVRWLDDVDSELTVHLNLLGTASAADTSWLEIDDRFFVARGYCWALRAQLLAVRRDFAAALRAHGDADAQLAAALAALADTQQRVTSPVILNGSEYGVLANHSLVLAGHVARTAAALRVLRARLASY